MGKQSKDSAGQQQPGQSSSSPTNASNGQASAEPICQICSGRLIEIRAKLVCERCHTIWETCCEGGRG
jgi:hypothetical protein